MLRINTTAVMVTALLVGSMSIAACSSDNDDAVGTETDKSDAGGVVGADSAVLPVDGVGGIKECVSDSQCVALFPEPPACRQAACVANTCKLLAAGDHAPCDDGDPCTVADTCLAGGCRAGASKDCDDDQPCTDDGCAATAGGCQHLANDNSCQGDGGCSVGVCADGSCASEPSLFERALALPEPGTVVAAALVPGGPVFFAVHALLPAPVTRAMVVSLAGGGAGTQKHTPLLPMLQVHDMVAGSTLAGAHDVVWLVGEVTRTGGGVDAGALGLLRAEIAAGTVVGPSVARSYGGEAHDALLGVVAMPSGFAAAGATASKGSGQHDAWFIRGSHTGFPLLDFSYGSADDEYAAAITPLVDGGFALAGRQVGQDGSDGLVFTIDVDAKLVWLKHMGGAFDDELVDVTQRADGSVAALGTLRNNSVGGGQVWLGVYGKGGTLAWERTYSADGDAYGRRMATMVDLGGALLLGGRTRMTTPQTGPWQPLAMLVDVLGNVQWQRVVKMPGGGQMVDIAGLKQGYVALADAVTGVDEAASVVRGDRFGATDCAVSGACSNMGLGCDDSNPCTADVCSGANSCAHPALPDGSPCGPVSTCAAGECKAVQ